MPDWTAVSGLHWVCARENKLRLGSCRHRPLPVAHTHPGVQHIDLFDGPSWDARGFWDDQPKPRSRLVVAAQLFAGLLMGLAIPVCFVAFPAALAWGFEKMLGPWGQL